MIISGDRGIYDIIALTLMVTLSSTVIAAAIGMPLGVLLGSKDFYGKRLIMRLVHTFMGLPPVVAGLAVLIVLSRKGPLGSLHLLYTPAAMVIAQVILITPIIMGYSSTAVTQKASAVRAACVGWGIGRGRAQALLMYECRFALSAALLAGFARAVSEVGAVMIVGGNIQYKTRMMTTAISLETGKGNYDTAIALGIVLLAISFFINSLVYSFQGRRKS